MFVHTGIGYAPEYYSRSAFDIVANADGDMLIGRNPNRVMLLISVPIAAVFPPVFYSLEQFGAGATRINYASTPDFKLTWLLDYVLVCSAVYVQGFGYPQTFNVTEIEYNPQESGECNHATGRPKTLTDKIKDYFTGQRPNSRKSNYTSWSQCK